MSRPGLVLLHHFGGSSRAYAPVAARLAGEATVLAPDARGHGDAPDVPPGWTVEAAAAEVAGLIAAAEFRDHVLCGHSMGGKVALTLAATRPPGLRALVLLAPSPPTPEPMSEEDRAGLRGTDRAGAEATVARITRRPLAPGTVAALVADELRVTPAARAWWADRGSREDVSAGAARVVVPVSVRVGGEDPAIPPGVVAREVTARLPGATSGTIPGAGHLLPLEAVDEVVRVLREALAGA